MAAGEGFEPSQTESESGVLPLHKPAIVRSPLTISQAHYYYMQISEKVKKYFWFFKVFSGSVSTGGPGPAVLSATGFRQTKSRGLAASCFSK